MTETGSRTDRNSAIQRVAIVTGGSRGIGRSAVLNLAARGSDVIFTYRADAGAADEVAAEARKHGQRVTALQVDVSKVGTLDHFTEQVRAELAAMGTDRFDYLVNNAGVWHTASFAETTAEDLDRLYAVNLRGVFFVTQKLIPLIRDGGGS
jgi:NAD(P)-dependent dehydrogenase (short-subunit alcohol dehydrogenase family)